MEERSAPVGLGRLLAEAGSVDASTEARATKGMEAAAAPVTELSTMKSLLSCSWQNVAAGRTDALREEFLLFFFLLLCLLLDLPCRDDRRELEFELDDEKAEHRPLEVGANDDDEDSPPSLAIITAERNNHISGLGMGRRRPSFESFIPSTLV